MALAWLEKAVRLRDSGLAALKVDPLLDPLRNEPRFRAIQIALNFPPDGLSRAAQANRK
jgi:hypothetical protein